MIAIVAGIGAAVIFLMGSYLGYKIGTEETERRWSEIVAKANYQRDLEARK